MPLVRAEVRNEYALGAPELYRETKKEDPKEILEGVAVAGLVGVLRQLGDLAEFAAEVFHGLQEEVTRTSSRSHKLMARVQRIETALSPLEKALLAQRSHLHFAYTAGSNWHARIRCEQNHFIYSDLPQFIMDTYEDCRRPPSLHLLDKFDPGGPGSCLKRYSDPTFFKKASVASGEASTDKVPKDKKSRKIKKRRSWPRNGKVSRDASFSYYSGRTQFTQLNIGGHASPSQTASTYDATIRSDLGDQSNLDLRNGSGYIEGDFRPSYSVEPEEQESRESISSPVKRHESDFLDYNFLEGKIADAYDDNQINISQERGGCISSSFTWDEKRETLEPTTHDSDNDGMAQGDNHSRHLESFSLNLDLETPRGNDPDIEALDEIDVQPCNQVVQEPESGDPHLDDMESETDHFMDALNTIESECETDTDCRKKQEAEHHSKLEEKRVDDVVFELIRQNSECQSSSSESNVLLSSSLINGGCEHSPISVSPKSPHAANSFINEVAAKDESNSVSLLDKDLQSSQRAGDSVRPSSPQNIDSDDNSKPDAGNYVESVSSTVSSNFKGDKPGIPIIDGTRSSADTHKASVRPSSPQSIDSHDNSKPVAGNYVKSVLSTVSSNFRGDEPNLPITDGTRSSADTHKASVRPSSPQSVDSHDNSKPDAGNYVKSVSSTVSSNFRGDKLGIPITDGTRSSADTHKASVRSSSPQSIDSHDNSKRHAGNHVKSVLSTVSSNFRGDKPGIPITDGTRSIADTHKASVRPSSPQSIDSHDNSKPDAGNYVGSVLCTVSSNFRGDEPGIPITDGTWSSADTHKASVRPSSPQSIDSHDNSKPDADNYVKSVLSTVSSNFRGDKPNIPITDGTRSSADTHKHAPETSNVTSVTFWTNGGLLGLQPSKPPDFSVLNALPQDPDYKIDGNISSSIRNSILSDKDSGKADQTENFQNIAEGEDQESGTSFRKTCWKISPSDLDINLGKLGILNQNNPNSTGSSVTASGSYLPVNSAFQADRKHQENSRSSSRVFELSNRLLSTGSNKKLMPGGNENTLPAGYKDANAFEQKNRQNVGYRTFSGRSKDLFGGESSILSPSSSPPLEHMKISFQPIDGFESSKLKLKFPDRNTNNESGSDIFPSFQLVPEVSIARYNVGTDSDADTFYRSSPSLSDDCHSIQSESNSEQWESSESPTSKDRDLYDALRRISLTESVSTLPENGRTNHEVIHGNFGLQFPFVENGVQDSESCRSFDLQSLGTINHSFRKELSNDTNMKDFVEAQLVPNPVPPPLPPVQWRGIMPHLNAIEDQCGPLPGGSYYAHDLMLSASTVSQPKPAPYNGDQIDTKNMQKSKQSISQKSNGQREANQVKSSEETDFLHQIRTKSFSLRPTVTTKPTVPSGASAAVQVTAILEKANAIRQAVGSDGEDDGTWSDT